MCQKGLANLFLTFTQPIFGNHDCRRHVGIPEAKKAWHVAQQPQTVVWLPSMPTEHFYTVDVCVWLCWCLCCQCKSGPTLPPTRFIHVRKHCSNNNTTFQPWTRCAIRAQQNRSRFMLRTEKKNWLKLENVSMTAVLSSRPADWVPLQKQLCSTACSFTSTHTVWIIKTFQLIINKNIQKINWSHINPFLHKGPSSLL